MYAIIETGGKQYRIVEGDEFRVEKLEGQAGDKIEFDKVLLVSDDSDLKVGKPLVEGAKVEAEILGQGMADKVISFNYKPKKGVRRKKGHRQPFTLVKINSIIG